MNAYIAALTTYLPEFIYDNEELARQFPEWSVDKIYEKTGIHSRHIAGEDESCSDMAVSAAEKLFLDENIRKEDIDYILLCTQSPDYFLPTTACLVQARLGLSTSCGALDFNLGCSGYIYGLSLAKGLLETNQAKNVLLITSELYSRYIADEDKSVRTLFGDASTATLLKARPIEGVKIGPFVFGSDGNGAQNLIVPHGGSKFPITDESHILESDNAKNKRASKHLFMNGAEILTFTLKTVPKSVDLLLEKSGLHKDDVDYVVFHQANKFMLEKLRKKIGFSSDSFLVSYEDYGNTVSSTIPLGLAKAISENKFKKGDKVLLVGFGVGYSWAGTIITC
jgi:3-oxoacyl-[acyl-carrier-protein] synthase III